MACSKSLHKKSLTTPKIRYLFYLTNLFEHSTSVPRSLITTGKLNGYSFKSSALINSNRPGLLFPIHCREVLELPPIEEPLLLGGRASSSSAPHSVPRCGRCGEGATANGRTAVVGSVRYSDRHLSSLG